MPTDDGKAARGPKSKWKSRIKIGISVAGLVIAALSAWLADLQWGAPHDFTPELERQYASLLRASYQDDLTLDPTETRQLKKFIDDNHLRGPSVEATRSELMTKYSGFMMKPERKTKRESCSL